MDKIDLKIYNALYDNGSDFQKIIPDGLYNMKHTSGFLKRWNSLDYKLDIYCM